MWGFAAEAIPTVEVLTGTHVCTHACVMEMTLAARIHLILVFFKGQPAEDVGETAARMLIANLESGGCVDEYLQDQVRNHINRIWLLKFVTFCMFWLKFAVNYIYGACQRKVTNSLWCHYSSH